MSEVVESSPFGQDEVDIAWQWRPEGAEQTVFAAVMRKETLDQQVAILKSAGLRPAAAYSQASALAFASGLNDGVVVELDSDSATVVLVVDGVVGIAHRLEMTLQQTPDERADQVVATVQRIAGYYADQSGSDLAGQPPVVLVGDVESNAHVIELLTKSIGKGLAPFRPAFTYPEHFPAEEYAANLGLALADRTAALAPKRLPMSVLPSLDLMPERHLPRPLPLLQVAIFVPMLLFAYVTLNISNRIEEIQAEGTALSSEVRTLELEARKQRLALAAVTTERQRSAAEVAMAADLEAFVAKRDAAFQTYAGQISTMIDKAAEAGLIVSNFAPLEGGYVIVGTASRFEDVSAYVALLKQTNTFQHVRVARMERTDPDGGGAVTFQVRALVTPQAQGN
jgi:hypothetical protein